MPQAMVPNWTRSRGNGSSRDEFSGVVWYGYHDRGVYEYGYFAFTGVGTMGVSTNEVFI
jgi:hypothetical protein